MSESISKYPQSRPFIPPPEAEDAKAENESPFPQVKRAGLSDKQIRNRTLRTAIIVVALVGVAATVAILGSLAALRPGKPPAPVNPVAAPVPSAPVPEETDKTSLALETVGTLTAAHLYQTYLNLGVLADAAEEGAYSDEDARKLLATVTGLIDTVDQQLTELAESALDAENRKKLDRVRALSALLRAQAAELRAYWDTPETEQEAKKQHEAKFHQTRQEAWAGIRELLGIQEK